MMYRVFQHNVGEKQFTVSAVSKIETRYERLIILSCSPLPYILTVDSLKIIAFLLRFACTCAKGHYLSLPDAKAVFTCDVDYLW